MSTIKDTHPELFDEAERQLSYWERHGNNPDAVAKWAVDDLLGILRFIVEESAGGEDPYEFDMEATSGTDGPILTERDRVSRNARSAG